MVSVSRRGERRTRVDVDLDENEAIVEVVKRRRVTDLFDENGELRLWQDAAGWSGYLVEDGNFFEVNWHRHSEGWIKFDLVDAETIVELAIPSHPISGIIILSLHPQPIYVSDSETTVNSSYSATIPAEVREQIDLEPGDRLHWTVDEDGRLVAEIIRERMGHMADMEPIDMGETDAVEETEVRSYEYD